MGAAIPSPAPGIAIRFLRYLRRNPPLAIGLALLLGLLLFGVVGVLVTDISKAYPLSAPAGQPPSWDYPFGTDSEGRDLLAAMVLGTVLTLEIALVAGGVGIFVGSLLGFVAGYAGGWLDAICRLVIDVFVTIPKLVILVVVAAALKSAMTVPLMALTVAALAWAQPARQVRAQVLSLRQRGYVLSARLSGMSDAGIIVRELLPNLIPFLAASFVLAVTSAIVATIGLEVLGLGPAREPTLGNTVRWMIMHSALLQGMWWWVLAPTAMLIILFVALFLVNTGLEELANPRLRGRR